MECELEVIGRHAMLFDDDANAAFVNSKDALVEWNNSLSIDRYDVRHLLSNPPASFRNLPHHRSSDFDPRLESDLDLERYADLPSSSGDLEVENEEEARDAGGYRAVPFSYGNTADSTDQRNSDEAPDMSTFRPPFHVPESLHQNLPPTEKVHQIIARTALFVGEHGGQSEIVLRVKQGDNPTFGFLMPHHHLHPYFRYLVDHLELLKADNVGKSQEEKTHDNQTSGALSLLGSVYGSGEDEDGAAEVHGESKQIDSGETSAAGDMSKSNQLEQTVSSVIVDQKDDIVSKLPHPPKVNATALSKNRISSIKPGHVSGMKKDGDIVGSGGPNMEKSKASSLFPIAKVETSLVDPPSEIKRLVDRIVEIILKNGKDFEAVLVDQDKKHGRFPFLLPSNQYHLYYIKTLKKAQESRLTSKSFSTDKDGLLRQQETDKKTSSVKESDFASFRSKPHDLPLDYDRKEKFKMVLPKSKNNSQDQPSKDTHQQGGVSVDATAAAAILQAATRGIKKPNLDILSKSSLNGVSHNSSNECGQTTSSLGSHQSLSQPQSSSRKQNERGKPSSVSEPVAKAIAKSAALAAASEADSSEAGLTREQKLKAERLRRAKMFAAMIKCGAPPVGKEPPGPGLSGSGPEVVIGEAKEREGSSVPLESGASEKVEKDEMKTDSSEDENERKSRKRRHYRSRKHDDSEGKEDEREKDEENEEEEEEDERRSRKKRRSHRSSRHHRDRSKEREKHRRSRSSKSKESRHRHKRESSSEGGEEEYDDRHERHKHESSSEDEHKHHHKRRSKNDRNHDSLSEDERKHCKRKHKKRSRRDEDRHEGRSRKDERGSHVEEGRLWKEERGSHVEEPELEEGEIISKSTDQSPSPSVAGGGDGIGSREDSGNVSKSSYQEPSSEITEVPDELRAKIRAMLLATM